MPKITKSNFKVSSNVTSKPLRLPEPQHRVFNRGDSNISMREFQSSKSSAEQIKDICLFYVNKCTGQYNQPKTAARYVHQMSDEILSHISGLISQKNRIESEPESYQKLLQEFKDAFPSSVSSPKLMAAELTKLQEEKDRLQETIKKMKQDHKRELDSLSTYADEQIKVYKDGIIKERSHYKAKIDSVIESYTNSFNKNQDYLNQYKQDIDEKYTKQFHFAIQEYVNQINTLKKSMNDLEGYVEELKLSIQDKEDIIMQKNSELMNLRRKLQKIEEEDHLSISISKASGSEIHGDDSFLSYNLDDDDKTIDTVSTTTVPSSAVGVPKDKNTESTSSNPIAVVSTGLKTEEDKGGVGNINVVHHALTKRKPHGKEKNKEYSKMIRQLKKEIIRLRNDKKSYDTNISTLEEKVKQMTDYLKKLEKELEDSMELNKELKRALRKQFGEEDVSLKKVIDQNPHPLCHTPHFLDRPDRTQLNKNLRQHILTGYNTAGIF